mmetsp:Transcript_19888/g.44339  ORF Transcript_19888/g.44339 Transcript_19888/m.44339 type:complete len:124 (+) Transcript_19888:929-1300(+)
MTLPALLGGDAAYHFGSVLHGLGGVEGALLAGEALADHPRVLVHPYLGRGRHLASAPAPASASRRSGGVSGSGRCCCCCRSHYAAGVEVFGEHDLSVMCYLGIGYPKSVTKLGGSRYCSSCDK